MKKEVESLDERVSRLEGKISILEYLVVAMLITNIGILMKVLLI